MNPLAPALLLILGLGYSMAAESSPRKPISTNETVRSVQESPRIPPSPELAEIMVQAGAFPGWHVQIRREGDGCLVGGPVLSAGAHFPRGTFDFRKVYDSFARSLQRVRTDRDTFAVNFVTVTNSESATTFFTRDAKLVRSVFDTAKQRCTPSDVEYFEKLWRERPPFPK